MEMIMDKDYRRNHPRSWADLYDDQNATMSTFGDLGPSLHPDDRSTAARHAAKRRQRDHEAAAERDLAVISQAAEHDADQAALVEATRLRQAGKKIPPHIRIRAARAARAAGVTRSSAEELADRYRRRS
jgi:hypothetical protein